MRVIENPVSGEQIVIRQSASDTDGALLSFDLYLPPGTNVPAAHAHPRQEEAFTVVEGTMRFRVGGRRFVAGPGETVRVPPGTSHWFGNDSMQTVHARVEARPALRLEEFFAANEALPCRTIAGRHIPRLTALADMLLRYQAEVRAPLVPHWLVRAVLALPAWFGRRNPQQPSVACAPHS
jgi:mannose-6-phosphate isomerase-like protein (cupin superfamily)